MHLLLAALLTVALYASVANAACCFPEQFEGELFIVEDQVVKTFAVDFSAKRIFDTASPYTEVFDIWDLENNRVYHRNGTSCSFKDSALPKHFPPCLRGVPRRLPLGEEKEPIKAYGYEIVEDDSHSFTAVNGASSACTPIFSQTKVDDLVHTALFKNVRLGVSHQKIYTTFDGCVEVEGSARWSK